MIDRIEIPGVTVDFRREDVRGSDGARIELRPRSFEVLRRLTLSAGELVTKDELLTVCWPDVAGTDESLTQCISDIRRALGESGRDLIRTVPRRGYALVLPGASKRPTEPSPWPSIAVLPFDEFGAEPASHGALGAGFAEDIITELARNRNLTVIARHSSFAAKAHAATTAEIAGMLGVRYVLEGSVRRAGERMIVNAQLIDSRDSRHVWADRYSFSASELFMSQDELVGRIAGTLFSEIRECERAASLRRPPANLDAYEIVLQAEAQKHRLTRDSMVAARAEAGRAVALDPHYAMAHIMLGFTIATDAGLAISGTVGPEALPGAIASIRRGIEIDPTLVRGHQALCQALGLVGRFDESLAAAERSAALGPSDAEALAFLSLAQLGVGQYASALENCQRAIALNPLFPGFYQGFRAQMHYALDQFDEASRNATASTERSAGYTIGYVIGAASDVALGRNAAAAERIASLLGYSPEFTSQSPRVTRMYAVNPALRARFVRHLREAGLPDRPSHLIRANA